MHYVLFLIISLRCWKKESCVEVSLFTLNIVWTGLIKIHIVWTVLIEMGIVWTVLIKLRIVLTVLIKMCIVWTVLIKTLHRLACAVPYSDVIPSL